MVADKEQMELFLEEVHPADILDAVHEYEGDPLELLRHLPEQFIASIIDEAEDEEKYELLTLFSKKKQMDIVDEMSSDELVDLLGAINETEQDSIIVNMDAEDAAEVRELLAYEPETAVESWRQSSCSEGPDVGWRHLGLPSKRSAGCGDFLLYICT